MTKIYWHYPHLKLWMGGTKFIYEVAVRINRLKRFEVILICNLGNRWIIDKFKKSGVKVITTTLFFSTNSLVYWLFFPFFFIRDFLKTLFFSRQGEILIATLFPSNLIMAVISVFTGKNYYYYCYEPFPYFHNKNYIESFPILPRKLISLLSILYKKTDIWATRKAHKIFTLNEVTQKAIKRIYKRDSIATLMGVDTKLFAPKKVSSVKKKFKNKMLITHSTDYSPAKRTDLAIKVIEKVRKKFPDALLLITSTRPNAPEKTGIEKLVDKKNLKKNVRLLGLVPMRDLPLYYSASACYLSCSYDEMLGTTSSNLPVKEAMACETPVIRADVTKEDVEDGISGFLADPRDTNLIAKKVTYLLNHPAEARQMGKKGRKKIVALYNWDKVAELIEKNLSIGVKK